jgi:hypothetical protein
MSHESNPQTNPFKLIEHKNILVPEVLTHEGREKDLEDYTKGWNDQSKNPTEILVPTEEKTSLRTAKNWYHVGAVKRLQQYSDYSLEGSSTEDHEKDLFDTMSNMRTNGRIIPDNAWPDTENNDDDEGSMKPRFS